VAAEHQHLQVRRVDVHTAAAEQVWHTKAGWVLLQVDQADHIQQQLVLRVLQVDTVVPPGIQEALGQDTENKLAELLRGNPASVCTQWQHNYHLQLVALSQC